jgi:hypothetical protein
MQKKNETDFYDVDYRATASIKKQLAKNRAKDAYRSKVDPRIQGRVISSLAFQQVTSLAAFKIYLLLLQKRPWDRVSKREKKRGQSGIKYYNAGHDGKGFNLPFTEAEAVLGIKSKATLYSAIQQLVRFGFIDVMDYGNYYLSKMARYSISDRWMKYNTTAFVEAEYKKSDTISGFDKQKKNGTGKFADKPSTDNKAVNFPSTVDRTGTSSVDRTGRPNTKTGTSSVDRTGKMAPISELMPLQAVR